MSDNKYGARLYKQSDKREYAYVWDGYWSCREFAQRDIDGTFRHSMHQDEPMSMRVYGMDMRDRGFNEQEGMYNFAEMLLPDYDINTDPRAIWIDTLIGDDDCQIYPAREVYSLMLFYIKNLSSSFKDGIDFDQACKTLIGRKHRCFSGIPDQLLGTALYFYAYVKYPKDLDYFRKELSRGNGPGTAMRRLVTLEEAEVGMLQEPAKFYFSVLDEWIGDFKIELNRSLTLLSKPYERYWYMPLLLQDIYDRVYDGDGRFDGMEYGDDEW